MSPVTLAARRDAKLAMQIDKDRNVYPRSHGVLENAAYNAWSAWAKDAPAILAPFSAVTRSKYKSEWIKAYRGYVGAEV